MRRVGQAVTFITPDEGPKWLQTNRSMGGRLTRHPWKVYRVVGNRLQNTP